MVLLVLAVFSGPSTFAANRPNVIVIKTDDQAQWSLGCYGNKECPTPNMDRIAAEGAKFNNAFVVTPVCSPSRASFFTGRYGTELGITDWITTREANAGVGLRAEIPTWPSLLQQAGYTTALIGKWHLGEKPESHPTKLGFTHFFGFVGGGQFPMDPTLEENGAKKQFKGPISDLLTDNALEFIDGNATKPFAMCLFYREPHQPYSPMPEQDNAAVEKLDPTIPDAPYIDPKQVKDWTKRYYASIHAADRNIGRVLAKLDELKLAENTVIIFTSDHGYNIGQHNLHTKGNASWIAGGVEGPKRPNMFEESIRVPLLVRWPGVTKAGVQIDQSVANIDAFATILAIAGVPIPANTKQHGVDYSPLLHGESMEPRQEIFGQYDLHNGGFASMRMIRTDRWKLVRHQLTNGLDELYDLQSDPHEKKNLWNDEASRDRRGKLAARLMKWQESINDPMLRNPLNTPGVGGTVKP
jgi:arylsulfatase A-like enzyme